MTVSESKDSDDFQSNLIRALKQISTNIAAGNQQSDRSASYSEGSSIDQLASALEKIIALLNKRQRSEDQLIELLEEANKKLDRRRPLAYTSAMLAEELNLNDSRKIDQMRNSGLLKGIKTGKGWIYPDASVDEFLSSCKGMDISSDENRRAAYIMINGRKDKRWER